jgi:hypothetical protein
MTYRTSSRVQRHPHFYLDCITCTSELREEQTEMYKNTYSDRGASEDQRECSKYL